jgi:hypothetical protein
MTLNTQLLATVLDELIPSRPDGRLPGAGTLGAGTVVEHAAAGTPELGQVLTQGFATLETLARLINPEGFGALSRSAQIEALRDLEKIDPMFVPTLLTLACVGYYSDERVLTALNGDARPPHPQGHEIEADDFSLLEGVRARGKLFRNC